MDNVLEMRNIAKEYSGNRVLKGVNIAVGKGEIHALVGENGAGKSTLMNILFGMPVIHATGGHEGEIVINGQARAIKSPFDAMKAGIGMVHQEFMLLPSFTVTENIKLNREILKDNPMSKLFGPSLKSLDMRKMRADAKKAIDTLEVDIDEWATVAGLPVGHMQFIEIAREIDKENVKILVFDEPTAVLAESEADVLLAALKRLAATGIGILFITHRLDEVFAVADRITILRDGEQVASMAKTETTMEQVASIMVGHKVEQMERTSRAADTGEVALSIRNLRVEMPGERVRDFSLDVKKGEIIGIGGLAGQGKIGVANGIMGLYRSSGEVLVDGKALGLNDPKESMRRGLAFVSEDRRGVGLLLDVSIEMNIAVSSMQVHGGFLKKYGFFRLADFSGIREYARGMIKEFDIRCVGPHQTTRRLSGGNQQKVCIARAITLEPGILFVSEPTRGIDIGAKKLVLDYLVKLNQEKGMTIVMTSSELAELRSVCDRIAIVSEGRLAGVLKPDAPDAQFGLAMAGETVHHGKEA